MNILISTLRMPFPPSKGDTLKIYNIAKRLAKNNKVSILTFYNDINELNAVDELKKINIGVYAVKFSKFTLLKNLILGIFSSDPFQVKYFYDKNYSKMLNKIIEEEKIDLVYYHLIRAAQYINETSEKNVIKIVDFTDAISMFLKRYYSIESNPIKKLLVYFEYKRVLNYESIASKFDRLYICSQKDKMYIKDKYPLLEPYLLENGIDTDYFFPEEVEVDKTKILLTGFMSAVQNVDAAIYFSENIFPLILKEIPDAKFHIVGKNPSKKVLNLQKNNTIVKGYVEDIKKEYLSAAVNIAPIRYGAGTQNKILESLALGVPVVANSASLKGMNEDLKRYVFAAENDQQFADLVVKIMKDANLRKKHCVDGAKILKENYSWDFVINSFEKELREVYLNKKGI